jgi:transcriptional regulator with XRE-family HTH domain
MTFGDKLREFRDAKGLSRQALAAASGVTFATIHGYEIGRRAPSFSNVVKLAAALGTDCSAFAGCEDVTGREDPTPKKSPRKKP